MGGIRIGGQAILGAIPNIPILAIEDTPNNYYDIWQIGNLAPPRRVNSTIISTGGNYPADPEASPTLDPQGIPTEFVYSIVAAGSGTYNTVQLVAWDDSSNVTIAVAPALVNFGRPISLMPSWHPDGTQVLYRDSAFKSTDITITMKIKRVDRDGTNDTVLYVPANNNFRVYNPMYSYDGSKIAWVEQEDTGAFTTDYRVWTMDADGSNVTLVAGPLSTPQSIFPSVAWANTSLTLAYMDTDGSAATADWNWRSVEADGTGTINVWTIDRAGHSFIQVDPPPIKWSWLPDDSAIVTTLLDGGLTNHELVTLDPAGGGPTTLGGIIVDYGTPDSRPVCMGTRVYYPTGSLSGDNGVDSVLDDGTDQRTDFDALAETPEVRFEGFKGDPIFE